MEADRQITAATASHLLCNSPSMNQEEMMAEEYKGQAQNPKYPSSHDMSIYLAVSSHFSQLSVAGLC